MLCDELALSLSRSLMGGGGANCYPTLLDCISQKIMYWVDAKVSADFFSFLCFKFLLKQNTINQQRIYHCYL